MLESCDDDERTRARIADDIPRSKPNSRPMGAPISENPASNPSCKAESFPAVIPSQLE